MVEARKKAKLDKMLADSAIQQSPSAERNKQPILEQLVKILPQKEDPLVICEFACGAGVHTTFFVNELTAAGFAIERWCPTDPDITSRDSVDAKKHVDCSPELAQLIQPAGDIVFHEEGATEGPNTAYNEDVYDLMTCINMIHISDWSAT